MWPYPWTLVGTPSHLGHMDRVAATMPSKAHAGAAQEAPDIGQWDGQDVPLVRPSSCNVKEGIPSSRRYLPSYLPDLFLLPPRVLVDQASGTKEKGSNTPKITSENALNVLKTFSSVHRSLLHCRYPSKTV